MPTTRKPGAPGQAKEPGPATSGDGAVHAALVARDRAALKHAAKALLLELMPAAIKAGSIPPIRSADELLAMARSDWSGPNAEDELSERCKRPQDRARFILGRIALDIESAVLNDLAGGSEWRVLALPIWLNCAQLRGYIDGFYRAGADRILAAADGQRKIGKATREKIAVHVDPLRKRGISRAQAAALAAPKVCLSESRLVKLLSQLYPGESWQKD